MRVSRSKDGQGWDVLDGETVVSTHPTNQAAWRAADTATGEAKSRAEDVANWIAGKD